MTDVTFDDPENDDLPTVEDDTCDVAGSDDVADAEREAAEEARRYERERIAARRQAERRQMDYLFERNFSIFAPSCARNGWAVYPQDADDKRRPSYVDYDRVKWSRYQEVGPTEKEVSRWHEAAKSNVALILGRASGNVFAIDIDVTDEALAWQIEDLADQIMGINNWRRVGNPPKRAILYRVETATELPPWSRHVLTDESGAPSENMIEILGQGRSLTAFGRHWKTNLRFCWNAFSPISDPPSVVPVTTQAKLSEFLEAVNDRLRPFVKKRALTTVEFDAGVERLDGDVYVPKTHLEYPVDAAGKVIDGRENYLAKICWATVRRNADLARNPATMPKVHAAVEAEFMTTASSAGRWVPAFLRAEIIRKCEVVRAKLERGETFPTNTTRLKLAPRPVHHGAAQAGHVDISAMLKWLQFKRTETGISLIDPPAGHDASADAISADPTVAAEAASSKNRSAIRRWIGDALPFDPSTGQIGQKDLIRGPTGLGKTVATLEELAAAAQTFGEPLRFGMAMPTHANCDETHHKAEHVEPHLDELIAEAKALANAEATGLKAMVYRGRTRVTPDGEDVCLYRRADAILLQQQDASAANLCSVMREVLDEYGEPKLDEKGKPLREEIACPGRHGFNRDGTPAKRCIYWLQQEEVAKSDLVIFPHAYMTMSDRMPEVLKDNLRAVIVDEDVTGGLIRKGWMPLSGLLRSRPEPKLTRRERASGIREGDLAAERAFATPIVHVALTAGTDPAQALLDRIVETERKKAIEASSRARRIPAFTVLMEGLPADEETALQAEIDKSLRTTLDACIAITGRAKRIESQVTPDTTSEEIAELTGEVEVQAFAEHEIEEGIDPQLRQDRKAHKRNSFKHKHARDEHFLWSLIRDRVLRLRCVGTTEGVEGHVSLPLHKTDPRIRVVGKVVRIVDRRDLALASKPTLFLDASAQTVLLSKFVLGEGRITEVEAPIRQVTIAVSDATYSKSSMLTRSTDETGRYVSKTKRLIRVRETLDAICGHHSGGRVLCVCPIKLRQRLTTFGYWPHNCDWMHYNATRGLDWAKNHVALITIGENNARHEDVDDIVAALTHDDASPEPMLVGMDGSEPEYRTTDVKVPLRNGGFAIFPMVRYQRTYAAAVQKAIRENELLQSWGRLRPIHRSIPGVVYHLGRTIPEGTILDDVISMPDLLVAFGALGSAIAVGHGAATTEAVKAKESADLDRAFTATIAAIEADADLHPGLHVVRAEDGRVALVSAVAAAQAVDAVAAAGYDVSSLPQVPEPVLTDADELRKRATLEQRWSAHDAVQRLKAWVFDNLRREGDRVWLPYGDDWGLDWKGKLVMPEPVSLREALEAMRGPAVEVANDDDEALAEAA